MTKVSTSGRFVWHELMARDVSGAKGFYGELLGWQFRGMDMGPMGTYTLVSAAGKDIGGIAGLEGNASPSWLSYCTVADVDAAEATAKKLGATVEVPSSDIPEVGRFAILRDHAGARFAPFKPTTEGAAPEGRPAAGTFCWTELVTQDPESSEKLYKAVFGWGSESKEMGPMGTYTIWKRGDTQAGGMMKAMDPRAPSMWLVYVAVTDLDQTFEKAKRMKAGVIVPPTPIPNMGRFAVIGDLEGATIGLFQG